MNSSQFKKSEPKDFIQLNKEKLKQRTKLKTKSQDKFQEEIVKKHPSMRPSSKSINTAKVSSQKPAEIPVKEIKTITIESDSLKTNSSVGLLQESIPDFTIDKNQISENMMTTAESVRRLSEETNKIIAECDILISPNRKPNSIKEDLKTENEINIPMPLILEEKKSHPNSPASSDKDHLQFSNSFIYRTSEKQKESRMSLDYHNATHIKSQSQTLKDSISTKSRKMSSSFILSDELRSDNKQPVLINEKVCSQEPKSPEFFTAESSPHEEHKKSVQKDNISAISHEKIEKTINHSIEKISLNDENSIALDQVSELSPVFTNENDGRTDLLPIVNTKDIIVQLRRSERLAKIKLLKHALEEENKKSLKRRHSSRRKGYVKRIRE